MAGATLAETFPRAALLAEDRLEVSPARYLVYAAEKGVVAKNYFDQEGEAWDYARYAAEHSGVPAILVLLQSGHAWRVGREEAHPVRMRTPLPALVVGGPGVLELVRNGSTLLLRRRGLVLGGVYRVQAPLWARLREPVLGQGVLVRAVAVRPGLMSTESYLSVARVGEGPWVG